MKTLTGYLRQVSEGNEFWMELLDGSSVQVTGVTAEDMQDIGGSPVAASVHEDGQVSEFPWFEKVTL